MLRRLAARRCGDLRLRGAVHCRAISSIADRSLTNLADAGLGARVLFATDEWFATADNLLQPHAPHFDSETFCTQGKVMDGWESRRRRLPGHDWALLRLGLAGSVKRVEIDTAHFTGNQTPAVRVLAACIDAEEGVALRGGCELSETAWLGPPRADLGQRGSCASADEIARARAAVEAKAEWCELVPESRLRAGYVRGAASGVPDDGEVAEGNSVHLFEVETQPRCSRDAAEIHSQETSLGSPRLRCLPSSPRAA